MTKNQKRRLRSEADMVFKERAKDYLVPCPVCGAGKYGGLFERCCDNPMCVLYNEYLIEKCLNCNAVRRMCSC